MSFFRVRAQRHRVVLLSAIAGLALVGLVVLRAAGPETLPVADRVLQFEPLAARSEAAAGPVALEAALPAEPSPAEQTPTPEPPPGPAPAIAQPASASPAPAQPAFEQLMVVDPLTSSTVQPVAFEELPAATVAADESDADASTPVYVPGSIGKAKRQWAGGSDAAVQPASRGKFIIGTGGGHCPVNGRVPPYRLGLD